ncbi:uncharacterized protein F13E9.13, mitochondrial-like [Lineus longissimus]|uniref:uncharacterized protein F13E9.13, mitochondrial-like n=1 Tax=Lineus longissimus TaxID=88925 RepID=UPI002B4DE60F
MLRNMRSAVFGMVHVRALPGTPRNSLTVQKIIEEACKEAEIYKNAGLDGIILENMHDIPYMHTESVGPEIVATMTAVCSQVRRLCPEMPLGVQILAGANKQALAVALAADLNFIRAEGFVFSHVADEGVMNACAGDIMRYRKQIGADHISVITDIKKKHSSHAITSDVDIVETALAAEFFMSDGVVITGSATGAITEVQDVKDVREAVKIPILVGSGVTVENVHNYLMVNAMIIGSHFKKSGHWENELDVDRIVRFMERVTCLRDVIKD